MYTYSRRGEKCVSTSHVLTSNRKFLPLADPIYEIPYTVTQQFPGTTWDYITNVHDLKRPEDIKSHHATGSGIRIPKNGCKGCGFMS